jgi:hypothetical protein
MSGISYGLVGDAVKQAFLEAETAVNTYAPPDLIKHSPGVAKALARWDTNPDGFSADYNMSTITDGGSAGNSDLVWDIDLTGTTVFYPVFCGDGDGQAVTYVSGTITATGLTALSFATSTNEGADRNDNFMALFGTQV